MEQYEMVILEEVKKELEHVDPDYQVCQWVLAMAVREEPQDYWLDEKPTFLVRVVTKTDECVPVDGLDVLFVVESDGTIVAPEFFENSPSFIGGPLEEGLSWCREVGKVCYLQLDNPLL